MGDLHTGLFMIELVMGGVVLIGLLLYAFFRVMQSFWS